MQGRGRRAIGPEVAVARSNKETQRPPAPLRCLRWLSHSAGGSAMRSRKQALPGNYPHGPRGPLSTPAARSRKCLLSGRPPNTAQAAGGEHGTPRRLAWARGFPQRDWGGEGRRLLGRDWAARWAPPGPEPRSRSPTASPSVSGVFAASTHQFRKCFPLFPVWRSSGSARGLLGIGAEGPEKVPAVLFAR